MRINEIITESEDYSADDIAEMLQRDCVPFLAAINYDPTDYKLWRGAKIPHAKIVRFDTNKNRTPVDMPKVVSNAIDDYFEETTGIRWRSTSVFASGNPTSAAYYGNLFCLFPIGEFHYCWSPRVSDLYNNLDAKLSNNKLRYQAFSEYPAPGEEDKSKFAFDTLRNVIMPSFAYQVDTELTEAIAMANAEIMITCDKYYMVNSKIISFVASIINNRHSHQ